VSFSKLIGAGRENCEVCHHLQQFKETAACVSLLLWRTLFSFTIYFKSL
jgi:hypothetical protein